jgi:hypothetical protein
LAELTNPEKTGVIEVYKNHWWSLDKNGDALIYISGNGKANSPQCNVNKSIVERLMQREGIDYGIVFIPWAYLNIRISDYV